MNKEKKKEGNLYIHPHDLKSILVSETFTVLVYAMLPLLCNSFFSSISLNHQARRFGKQFLDLLCTSSRYIRLGFGGRLGFLVSLYFNCRLFINVKTSVNSVPLQNASTTQAKLLPIINPINSFICQCKNKQMSRFPCLFIWLLPSSFVYMLLCLYSFLPDV